MAGGCGGAGQAGGANQQAAFSVGGGGNGGLGNGIDLASAQFQNAVRQAGSGFGGYGMPGMGMGMSGRGMPGMAGFSATGAQGVNGAGTTGMGQGSALLAQATQAGRVAFYGENGGRQAFDLVGQVLDNDPAMLQAFAQSLSEGETFQFGMRTGGGPSFSTVGARNHRIELNSENFAEAPNGPMEVATHEMMHAMGARFGLNLTVNQNHGMPFYSAVNSSLQRQGVIG